jgi:segregation and condensation protein B
LSEADVTASGIESGADYSMGTLPAFDGGLQARLEALLFVAAGPVEAGQLASALQAPLRDVERALDVLRLECIPRGLRLQRHRSSYQLTTAPELATDVEHFLNLESVARLTRAALEVLAIVAYEQPVTRPQIDSVRGVNSDSALQTLLRYGLIEETGRSEGPGRPILYASTPDFLQHFGLGSLGELPPLSPQPLPDASPGAEANG